MNRRSDGVLELYCPAGGHHSRGEKRGDVTSGGGENSN